MNLSWSELSDLFLMFCLFGGFVLIIYANAEYLPGEGGHDEDDWF